MKKLEETIDYADVWKDKWFDMERYNPTARHLFNNINVFLKRYCSDQKNLLDVGCGAGFALEEIDSNCPWLSLNGCDISDDIAAIPNASIFNEKKAGYFVFDLNKKYKGKKFDIVLCNQVLEHIKDDNQAAANLIKMTGEYLIVTVPSGAYNSTSLLNGHYRHYSEKQLKVLFSPFDLEYLEFFSWGFPFHSLYKFLLGLFSTKQQTAMGLGHYGWIKRTVASLIYVLFFLNKIKMGANILMIAKVKKTK